MLKFFEKKGLIEKEKSLRDGRYYNLHLIQEGQKIVDDFNKKSHEQIENIIQNLTNQEVD